VELLLDLSCSPLSLSVSFTPKPGFLTLLSPDLNLQASSETLQLSLRGPVLSRTFLHAGHLVPQLTHENLFLVKLPLEVLFSLRSFLATLLDQFSFFLPEFTLGCSQLTFQFVLQLLELGLSGPVLLRSLLHPFHLLSELAHLPLLGRQFSGILSFHLLLLCLDTGYLALHLTCERLHLGLGSFVLLGTFLHLRHPTLQSSHLGFLLLQVVSILLAVLSMLLGSFLLKLSLLFFVFGLNAGFFLLQSLREVLHPLHGSYVLLGTNFHLGHFLFECVHLVFLLEELALENHLLPLRHCALLLKLTGLLSPRRSNLFLQSRSECLHLGFSSLVFL